MMNSMNIINKNIIVDTTVNDDYRNRKGIQPSSTTSTSTSTSTTVMKMTKMTTVPTLPTLPAVAMAMTPSHRLPPPSLQRRRNSRAAKTVAISALVRGSDSAITTPSANNNNDSNNNAARSHRRRDNNNNSNNSKYAAVAVTPHRQLTTPTTTPDATSMTGTSSSRRIRSSSRNNNENKKSSSSLSSPVLPLILASLDLDDHLFQNNRNDDDGDGDYDDDNDDREAVVIRPCLIRVGGKAMGTVNATTSSIINTIRKLNVVSYNSSHHHEQKEEEEDKVEMGEEKNDIVFVATATKKNDMRFPVKLFYMIQQGYKENPDVCSWSNDGRNILVNSNHPDLQSILCKHFNRTYIIEDIIIEINIVLNVYEMK
jgi:hypothetical protein